MILFSLFWFRLLEDIPVNSYRPASFLHVLHEGSRKNALREQLSVPIPRAQRVTDGVHLQPAFPLGGFEPGKVVAEQWWRLSQFGQQGRLCNDFIPDSNPIETDNFISRPYSGMASIQRPVLYKKILSNLTIFSSFNANGGISQCRRFWSQLHA